MQEYISGYKGLDSDELKELDRDPMESLVSSDKLEGLKVPDKNSLGAQVGRVCAILETMRDGEGRTSDGRILAILSTDAEKLLGLIIGFNAAELEIPERFQSVKESGFKV